MTNNNRRKIGLQNFRVFKNYQEFEIAPITILTGTNSSGKRSFVKAVRLLQENFRNPSEFYDEYENLNFQLPDIHLGGFNKVFNYYASDPKVLLFNLSFDNKDWETLDVQLRYSKKEKSRFNDAQLEVFLLTFQNKDKKEVILSLDRRKFESNDNGKTLIYWGGGIILEFWFKKFEELKEKGLFQEKAILLYRHLTDLRGKYKENYKDYIKGDYKVFYDTLIGMGISPVEPNFDKRDTEPPYFIEDMDFQLFYINSNERVKFNGNAQKIYKHISKYGTLIAFPLFLRPEWRLNFNKDFSVVENVYSREKEIDKSDFNFEVFNAINSLLKKREVTNIFEAFNLFKTSGEDAIMEVLDLELSFHRRIRGTKDITNTIYTSDEYGSMLSHFLMVFFDSQFRILKKDVSITTLEGLLFFDNDINVLNSSEKSTNEGGGIYWSGFSESYLLVVEIIQNTLKEALKSLGNLKEIEFINSERIVNRRVFLDSEKSEFNTLINQYLHIEFEKKEKLGGFTFDIPITFEDRKSFINKWLTEFDIAQGFSIDRDEDGIGSSAYLMINDKKVLLADVGFGINKLFPVILKMAISPKNSTIFIEEPESNLHPGMQSKLADLLVDAHQTFNHYFVLETHSEYLIRKLQFLVANEKSTAKAEDINIYYLFHPDRVPEGRKQVEKLEIRIDGGLSADFGPGFIDEAINWKFELMRMKQAQKN
jgi:predicted ATPase